MSPAKLVARFKRGVPKIRKAIVNAVGLATSLLALGLLHEPYAGYVSGGIAIATAVLHFNVPNEPLAPSTVPRRLIRVQAKQNKKSGLTAAGTAVHVPEHAAPPPTPAA